MKIIRLRHHHILDIITSYGAGDKFEPSPYGHAVHSVAQLIISESNTTIELIVGADEICMPCKFHNANGLCDDVLKQLDKPISKQEYNDKLDNRLFEYFGFSPEK